MGRSDETKQNLEANWSPNNPTSLDTTNPGSSKKALWVCSLGHEWETEVRKILQRGAGCPYCKNKRLLSGFNSLDVANPELASLWSSTNQLSPKDVLYCTTRKFHWECGFGHKWISDPFSLNRLSKEKRCKECFINSRSIAMKTPHLASMLVNESDESIYYKDRAREIEWQCPAGHHFKKTAFSMNRTPHCLYCSGYEILSDSTDLGGLYPDLAKEWIDSRRISEFKPKSNYKSLWRCLKCSHEWKAAIYNRTGRKSGCPHCSKSNVSKQEIVLFKKIQEMLPEYEILQKSRSIVSGYELDIYIPEMKIAVEYNGLYWHSSKFLLKDYHFKKWLKALESGIDLLYVWEDEWLSDRESTLNRLHESFTLERQSYQRLSR